MPGRAGAKDTRRARVAVTEEAATETPFELLASKLLVPRMRSSVVDRPGLLERLCEVDGPPIVTVTCDSLPWATTGASRTDCRMRSAARAICPSEH